MSLVEGGVFWSQGMWGLLYLLMSIDTDTIEQVYGALELEVQRFNEVR